MSGRYPEAFFDEKHIAYILKLASDVDSFESRVMEHLRMSALYWALSALSILGKDLNHEMNVPQLVDWIFQCQKEDGGFGGNIDHDSHILYTLSAVQCLVLTGNLSRLDFDRVARFVASMQLADGSFQGDQWGEVDTRFSYCALSTMALLNRLNSGEININLAIDFVLQCQNFDSGFGSIPGAESHAGQIFCCIGLLSIVGALEPSSPFSDRINVQQLQDRLGWWLSERQVDSGGLNGRPEKQADVCYSWWIISSLSLLHRLHWIDPQALIRFIIKCQDDEDGGIADRPQNMADVFHTFFGIAGLSLLGYLNENEQHRPVNPTFAIPQYLLNINNK